MEKIVYKGVEISIYREEYPDNPRKDWDNLGKMICFHSRYDLGDKHELREDMFDSWQEMEQHLLEQGALCILPLYLFDHSGLSISTEPFNCKFDSGLIGFIYMDAEGFKEIGLSTEWREKYHKGKSDLGFMEHYLKGEVETYDQYLRGDVYGYSTNNDECEGCTGFFGYNHEESGLLYDARGTIDAWHRVKLLRKLQRLKQLIKSRVPICYRKLETF